MVLSDQETSHHRFLASQPRIHRPERHEERGKRVDDVWNLILSNTRQAVEISGDLLAMAGACTVGARRVEEIVGKYGVPAIVKSVD